MTLPLSLHLYRLAAKAIEPLAPVLLRRRTRQGKEDAARLGERFGKSSIPRPPGQLVWMHGVSVGESLSLLPLIDRLQAERPEISVLITSGTRASAEVLAQRLPTSVIHQYVPLDLPGAARRFLDHWRPDVAVFVESELWPNLILGAAARGTRLALVSARLSRGSLATWQRARGAALALFGVFELILARDIEAAETLRGLGARVDGIADLKLGAAPLPVDDAEFTQLRDALAGRPMILAASTHPGEDAMVLDAFARVRDAKTNPLLVIAPRHVERASAIEALATQRGLSTGLRSMHGDPADLDVYIADTIGEFGLLYRLARLAFLGGSLAPGLGGHNPLEPARLGCPVVSGNRVENWPIFHELERREALRLVDRGEALEDVFREALDGSEKLQAMARSALSYVAGRDLETLQALERIMTLLDR